MNSRVTITFNSEVGDGEYVCFRGYASNTLPPFQLYAFFHMRWRNFRSGPGEVAIGSATLNPGERSAINYVSSFMADYNSTDFYLIERSVNVVTITSPNSIMAFDRLDAEHDLSPSVSMTFENIDLENIFQISTVEVLPATTNPVCSHYKVRVTCSQLATEILWPLEFAESGNTDNPFEFEKLRGSLFKIKVQDENGSEDIYYSPSNSVPGLFSSENINLQITQSPAGASVTVLILALDDSIMTYEYGLEGGAYQYSNVFPGLLNGDYQMNVRDNFGCVKSKSFTVTGNNIVNSHSYISESNSIRLAKRITPGICGPYRTDRESLSCEEFCKDPGERFEAYQPFQTCDTPPSSFESNFSENRAWIIQEDGSETELQVLQKTNFIGIKDSRDARRFDLGSGLTGIYFLSGNLYDYDTGFETGDDYLLNGGLPEWGRIDNFIFFAGAWHQIANTFFSDEKDAEVLIIQAIYTGADEDLIVKAEYNRQVFNVFEFYTPFALYPDEILQVRVDMEDPNFENESWLSEKLDIQEEHEGCLNVVYYNDENTDVYYKTGIKHQIRIPIMEIDGDFDSNQDPNKTDTKVDLLSADLYDLEEFTFQPTSKGLWRQWSRALSHKYVLINGEGFIKSAKFEQEGPLGSSNLYELKCSMMRSNAPYTTDIIGAEAEIINSIDPIDVPNLITPDTDTFISY
jgi:hypothetical protein